MRASPHTAGAATSHSRGRDIRREADVIMGLGCAKTLAPGTEDAQRGVGKRDAG
jgi:hypothetical protein